jgi:hypothetical protein
MHHAHRLFASVAMGLLIAACSTSTPAPTTAPSDAVTDRSPVPSALPEATATAPVPSAPPRVVPPSAPPTATPSPSPAPSFTSAERRLLDALRADTRVGCAPRRADLPEHAVAGVECRIGSALVDRVGVYGFDSFTNPNAGSALDAYVARLSAAGVTLTTGDCRAGTTGDRAWPANIDDAIDGESDGYRAERSGCFLDENGIANVRLTCYGDLYIGVLGTNRQIADLYAWAWRVAAGESVHRDPPGICSAPD